MPTINICLYYIITTLKNYAILSVVIKLTPIIGKTIRVLSRIHGGGSALPGLVVEKIDPNFVAHCLNQLPYGVVVISGTNGKTTTTKIVVELLTSQGLKVFTNKSGSNFIRGVASSLIADIDLQGKLDADIAILELDEAHAVHFVKLLSPKYCLLLNVMRDQLDRFGEIDTTADMLSEIAKATTNGIVINREDPRLLKIGDAQAQKGKSIQYFGIEGSLRKYFVSDDDIHEKINKINTGSDRPEALALLSSISKSRVDFMINKKHFSTDLQISGIHNIYNATAALALAKIIMPEAKTSNLINQLAKSRPAFGRGEMFKIGDSSLELVLVKNPAGFRLALESYAGNKKQVLVAINDSYADGRDMSWLWDVDFLALQNSAVSVTGSRAYDMAIRLEHDSIEVQNIEIHIPKALKSLISSTSSTQKQIYCTYTAMLEIRRLLQKYTSVERVL
jgi:UDP-N-acetylmuramyl tripeptide synthase